MAEHGRLAGGPTRDRADAAPVRVSVVAATRDRAPRLRRLLAGLREQTLPRSQFEVVVVDDGSSDETSAVLDGETRSGGLRLRTVRHDRNLGRARAREAGWRHASGPLIAFIDDDCVPEPDWLERGLAASEARPGTIVQGRTYPDPDERDRLGPFARTVEVAELDPAFQTCNIVYPREALERVGGFDVDAFGRVHGSEDSDLAWRAIKSGFRAEFDPALRVRHAVNRLGPLGSLRFAAGWSLLAYVRHPELRRAHFASRLFWKQTHIWLLRALLALLVPRRLWPLALWLALPYLRSLYARGKVIGGGPALAPYYALYDACEVAAALRNAVRHRTLIL